MVPCAILIKIVYMAQNIYDVVLKYVLIFLFLALIGASYYRFVVLQDYYVSYEIECDPYVEECFVGCEDDACEVEYYYSLIERHAHTLYGLCGDDITDCEAATYCSEEEAECSLIMCSADEEECDLYTHDDMLDMEEDAIDAQEESLIDETI